MRALPQAVSLQDHDGASRADSEKTTEGTEVNQNTSQEEQPKGPALLRLHEVQEGTGHPTWSQGQKRANEQKS